MLASWRSRARNVPALSVSLWPSHSLKRTAGSRLARPFDCLMTSAGAAVSSNQRQPLGFIILTLLSATGGLIVLRVQSYLALKS